MSRTHYSPGITSAALLGGVAVVIAFLAGCQGDDSADESAEEWAPFVQLALQQSSCSDIRNRVFVIDRTIVLIDHAGNCADGSFSQVLYGDSVDDVLCNYHDSIGGPVKNCPVPAYAEMFEIIITHLDARDLGLGPTHVVQQLPLT
jgi:hypothetical protein